MFDHLHLGVDKRSSECYNSNIPTNSKMLAMSMFESVVPSSYGRATQRKDHTMSIALSATKPRYGASAQSVAVVPAAAVWDGESVVASGRRVPVAAGSVRTLRVEYRTPQRLPRTAQPGIPRSQTPPTAAVRESNRGNYVLGAIFGAVLCVATVFGGMSSSDAVAPQQPASVSAELAR